MTAEPLLLRLERGDDDPATRGDFAVAVGLARGRRMASPGDVFVEGDVARGVPPLSSFDAVRRAAVRLYPDFTLTLRESVGAGADSAVGPSAASVVLKFTGSTAVGRGPTPGHALAAALVRATIEAGR